METVSHNIIISEIKTTKIQIKFWLPVCWKL
jgi:hypothetical protein